MPMPTAAACPHPLSAPQIDGLIAHPYWEPLGPTIDPLVLQMPRRTERAERTTLLTWIYQRRGVATFGELSDRLTGLANLPKRKKHLRQALRAMEKLMMVTIVNFPGDDDDAPDPDDDVVGRSSLVSLTWTGMLWLRRAWFARQTLAGSGDLVAVHQHLVQEEDEAGWNDPYWVENVSSIDPESADRRTPCAAPPAAITSVFDLSQVDFRCAWDREPAPVEDGTDLH